MRYPETQGNESGGNVQLGRDTNSIAHEGNDSNAEFDFECRGYHIGDCYLLTNRHVVQPWLADDRAQSLNSTVRGQPRLRKLVAYFPDQPQPLVLKFKQASSRDDVAVCMIDSKDLPDKVPVLPLEHDGQEVVG